MKISENSQIEYINRVRCWRTNISTPLFDDTTNFIQIEGKIYIHNRLTRHIGPLTGGKRSKDYFVRYNPRSQPLVGSYLAPHKFNNYKAVKPK